jgi:hypothetical protein
MILFSMKRFSSIKRQTCARWVLLFGILAGLFFSGGEGIQLFPFPVTELNHSKISASNLEENPKSYAFSVFSSRNYSTLLKSKFQKDANQYLSGELLTCAGLDLRANFCLSSARNHKETDLLRRSLDPDSQSDRAPPAA